jgi:hypothetical protein
MGDGRKIDGKRVLVDVERGRTVPNWRPRRLGGGLGNSRIDPKAPVPPPPDFGSGGGGGQERTEEDKERERARERQHEADARERASRPVEREKGEIDDGRSDRRPRDDGRSYGHDSYRYAHHSCRLYSQMPTLPYDGSQHAYYHQTSSAAVLVPPLHRSIQPTPSRFERRHQAQSARLTSSSGSSGTVLV